MLLEWNQVNGKYIDVLWCMRPGCWWCVQQSSCGLVAKSISQVELPIASGNHPCYKGFFDFLALSCLCFKFFLWRCPSRHELAAGGFTRSRVRPVATSQLTGTLLSIVERLVWWRSHPALIRRGAYQDRSSLKRSTRIAAKILCVFVSLRKTLYKNVKIIIFSFVVVALVLLSV